MAAALVVTVALLACAPPAATAADALPTLGPAPVFALTSQDMRPVNSSGLRGKVLAVTFLYTACPDICPTLTQKLLEVQESLAPEFGDKIVFVAITLDPERDTPVVLKDYARAFGANLAYWSFLTGPAAAVRDVVRRYGVVASKTTEGFIEHNLVTSIIDARVYCGCSISACVSMPTSSGAIF